MGKEKVYLVGAGPGNPELITVRGHALLTKAEVVIYDSLANERLLELAPTAKKINVGKRAGRPSPSQEEINQLLVSQALTGKRVVRLKGGDPFIFGRGGEEIISLSSQHIPYEIVPGVTSGVAAPAYMGIPVTHRGVSRSVTFITAQTKEQTLDHVSWESLVKLGGTIVFYMGLKNLSHILKQLISHGIKSNLPVAVICNGTFSNQEMAKGTIADIEEKVINRQITAPALIVFGEVVNLHETCAWFKKKTLAHQKIIITRASNQSSKLQQLLEEEGAEATLLPTIDILPKKDLSILDIQMAQLAHYDWIFFTSVNAIHLFFERLSNQQRDIRSLGKTKIACIGEVSRKALHSKGIFADFIPVDQSSEGLVREFSQKIGQEKKVQNILLPTSTLAGDSIEWGLKQRGHNVCTVAFYENRPIEYDKDYLHAIFAKPVDWITFCSSSAVSNFMSLVERYQLSDHLKETRYAAIGPMTAEKLKQYKINATVIPPTPTIEAMAREIVAYHEQR